MGVRREERITMSEGSLRRMLLRPLRIGLDMVEGEKGMAWHLQFEKQLEVIEDQVVDGARIGLYNSIRYEKILYRTCQSSK